MSSQKEWADQRIELLSKHFEELSELSANTMQGRRALTERHQVEQTTLDNRVGNQARRLAELLTQQSEELVALARQNTNHRLSLLERQQRELSLHDQQRGSCRRG